LSNFAEGLQLFFHTGGDDGDSAEELLLPFFEFSFVKVDEEEEEEEEEEEDLAERELRALERCSNRFASLADGSPFLRPAATENASVSSNFVAKFMINC
jgi:hypothetical protein